MAECCSPCFAEYASTALPNSSKCLSNPLSPHSPDYLLLFVDAPAPRMGRAGRTLRECMECRTKSTTAW